MSKMFRRRLTFLLPLILLVASLGLASSKAASINSLSVTQESAVVGGDACKFVAGVGLGLAIGGLFGCVPCAAVGVGIDAVTLFAC
jgi:hypothetical protein